MYELPVLCRCYIINNLMGEITGNAMYPMCGISESLFTRISLYWNVMHYFDTFNLCYTCIYLNANLFVLMKNNGDSLLVF